MWHLGNGQFTFGTILLFSFRGSLEAPLCPGILSTKEPHLKPQLKKLSLKDRCLLLFFSESVQLSFFPGNFPKHLLHSCLASAHQIMHHIKVNCIILCSNVYWFDFCCTWTGCSLKAVFFLSHPPAGAPRSTGSCPDMLA